MLNVADIVYESSIYGPGLRTVIWFQGCSIHCQGCINPHLWSFQKNREYSAESLCEAIQSTSVTLLGGEPLDQPDIEIFLNGLSDRNISVILFTGYEISEIEHTIYECISRTCDAIVCGRFDEHKIDKNLYLRGSTNQEIIIFNDSLKIEVYEQESYEITFGSELSICGRVNKNIFDLIEK